MNREASERKGASSPFSPRQIHAVILVLGIASAFYLCWLMVRPFVAVITWAAALAILAHPLHAWIARRMRPNAAALISVCLVSVVIVTPAVFLSQRRIVELTETLQSLGTDLNSANLHANLQQYPAIVKLLEWVETRLDVEKQIQTAAGAVAGRASAWVSGSIWILTQLVLTFLTLFYFFRDRKGLLRLLRRLIPFSATETDEMLDRIAQTIHTSVSKNLLVKLIQGFLGGLMFWILGLPAPVLFGAAMALLALLPVMGTAFVWAPAAILLVLKGSWVKAIILAIWGGVVVGLIDNFLYPLLVANDLRLHPLAVFFSVFGGLLAFGLAGAVLGPVILAITVVLLALWQLRAAEPA